MQDIVMIGLRKGSRSTVSRASDITEAARFVLIKVSTHVEANKREMLTRAHLAWLWHSYRDTTNGDPGYGERPAATAETVDKDHTESTPERHVL